MRRFNLALLGFGNVGQCLARLLLQKSAELRDRYAIDWRLTGVATRRLGWLADPEGLDVEQVLSGNLTRGRKVGFIREWLSTARADVLFEVTSVNAQTGQPALDHLRAALDAGAHAITANKGALVHGYRALRDLAAQKGRRFLFEACVLGGTPVFSVFRETLPAANLLRFRGLLNTTTNVILKEMESGCTFDAAVKKAQELGVAETDPSTDVDGWDAALKVHALATVLMDAQFRLDEIQREGIRGVTPEAARAARAAGKRICLVARVENQAGRIVAAIGPEVIEPGDLLGGVGPTGNILHFELDTLRDLIIASGRQGPDTTAYGLLADFLTAVGSYRRQPW